MFGREGAGEPIEYLTPPGLKASPVYSRVARVNDGKLIYLSGLFGKTATDLLETEQTAAWEFEGHQWRFEIAADVENR